MTKIPLTDKTQIRVSKDTVNGVTFIQLRVWVTDKETGSWIPTKKGVAFKPDLCPDVVQALELAHVSKDGDKATA
tara:strand:- start:58 stop:282 length:225 start_codon:yes stop_codon:yes gene_type:complete